jgi:hypothetical protein
VYQVKVFYAIEALSSIKGVSEDVHKSLEEEGAHHVDSSGGWFRSFVHTTQ